MKKIENVLLLPILVLIVLVFNTGTTTLDIHLHDTYFVLANAQLVKWFLYWLVVQFILYTVIRYRHKRVNTVWAVSNIGITIGLIALTWYCAINAVMPAPEDRLTCNTEWETWGFNNQMIITTMLAFLLNQIAFLIYFVIRLFQTPDLQ